MLLIVGDYLSSADIEEGGPFRSKTNYVFRAMMRQVGLSPSQAEFTNVISYPPSGRDSIFGFCGPKEQGQPGVKFVKRGSYLAAEHWSEVERLWRHINHLQPNLIVAAGDLALWALTSETSMEVARGRIHSGNSAIYGRKVLPVYSAKHVVQNYPDRMILIADLEKAKREMQFPEIRRPQRMLRLYPDLNDLEDFYNEFIVPSPVLDCDIETKGTMITCVGFAPSPNRAIVVPFYDELQPDGNYWRTKREEFLAWSWVRRMLKSGKRLGGQNFQYDMQYLWRTMGIKCPDFTDDTMLMHHALFPEMRKGLGFLASLYTDELPWKFMHKVKADDKSSKKEDL